MQHSAYEDYLKTVVISFQFSTFVSLMQRDKPKDGDKEVVISFQFSTFVSLMQLESLLTLDELRCD